MYKDIACKANFFPPKLRQAAKIYVSTSYSVVRQETIEISEQRTAFVCFFAQEVDRCMKDCDKQRLQTTVSINLWKILAGHTGDWFDVKTASICTTELWDALKSFILTSLKFKVAPYRIIVSLDTLMGCLSYQSVCNGFGAHAPFWTDSYKHTGLQLSVCPHVRHYKNHTTSSRQTLLRTWWDLLHHAEVVIARICGNLGEVV